MTIATSAGLLAAGGWPHTWAARASGRIYDGWAPTVWITDVTDDAAGREVISTVAANPGAGSVVVSVGADAGQGLRVDLTSDGGFRIPALDLHGRAQTLRAEVVDQLADLLEDADAPVATKAEQLFIEVPATAEEPVPPMQAREPGEGRAYEDPPYDVLVRFCGRICVDGVEDDLPHHETSVAAFVALNGRA